MSSQLLFFIGTAVCAAVSVFFAGMSFKESSRDTQCRRPTENEEHSEDGSPSSKASSVSAVSEEES